MSRRLTAREAEIVEMVKQGLSNAQIAHKLGLIERMVVSHLCNVAAKMWFPES